MKLSISVRVAEAFDNKERASHTIAELVALARKYRYEGVCMRASQAGVQSAPERVKAVSGAVRAAGLRISMITGDFAVPGNGDDGPNALRHITPYLDLAQAFDTDLIRVCMKKPEDIEWARRASEEAGERGIRLAHQSHWSTLFETVRGAAQTLEAVGRENFGLIYEPANWMIVEEDYGPATIRRLKPWIFNVYIQNHRVHPAGKSGVPTWVKGWVPLDHIGIWEDGGVRVDEVFAGLDAIGYAGFVTVHQAFADVMPVEDSVRQSAEFLMPLIALPGRSGKDAMART